MTTNNDLDQAREWAEWIIQADSQVEVDPDLRGVANVIQSLPDEWIDADKLREAVEEARLLIRDGEPEMILNDLNALLPAPQPRTMSTPKKYRKKPVTVEASLWRKDGDHDEVGLYRYPPVDPITGGISAADDAIFMGQLRHSEVPEQFRREACDALMDDHGWIDTLEGGHTVCPGDYIIRGVQGEFYPCKPDIFAATYEEVEA